MQNKRLHSLLLVLISIGILLALIYYLYYNADHYHNLLNVSALDVFWLFVVSFAFQLFNSIQNTYVYRAISSPRFSQRDGFLLTTASSLANQLPLPGGIATRGFYLKRRYNLSYAKFASSTIALFFLFLAVNGFVGLGVLSYWTLFQKTGTFIILWVGNLFMLAGLLVFQIPISRITIPEKLRKPVEQAIEGWHLIGANSRLIGQIISLQSVLIVLLAIRYWLAFHMLSQNITIGQALLFASVTSLTQLVNILPGGLGAREALVGSVAAVMGVDPVISIAAVSLERLVTTAMIVLTGGVSTIIIGK